MSVRTRATVRGAVAGFGWAVGIYLVLSVVAVLVGIGICVTAPPQVIAIYFAFVILAVSLGATYFGKKAYRSRMNRK